MLKKLDNELFNRLLDEAKASERLRSHNNFHPFLEDPVQRLCVAIKKDSYIRPHRHTNASWEMFIILKGRLLVVIYDDQGVIIEKIEMISGGSVQGVEIAAGSWHSIIAMDDVILMEFKQGPYVASKPDDFAAWAPEEKNNKVSKFMSWVRIADVGERFSKMK